MTKDKALKLALEALEHEADKGNDDAYKVERDAIKEALAQPEQEPDWKDRLIAQQEETILWQAKRISEFLDQQKEQEPVLGTKTWFEDGKVVTQYLTASDIYKEPEQEPVAYVVALDGQPISMTVPVNCLDKLSALHNAPLYTAPPKREWVGLTNADWNSTFSILFDMKFRAGAEWAEAKLKEKNT